MKKVRAQETEEARTNRRDSNKARMQENRAQETPEASATRRISTRIRNRKARAQETPETRTNSRILNREKCNKTEHKRLQKHVLTTAFQTGKYATKQSTRNSRNTY